MQVKRLWTYIEDAVFDLKETPIKTKIWNKDVEIYVDIDPCQFDKVRNIFFLSSSSHKTRKKCYFKKNIIVNFNIQKLKSKHTSLKKYIKLSKTKWANYCFFSHFEGTRGEKNKYFAPKFLLVWCLSKFESQIQLWIRYS